MTDGLWAGEVWARSGMAMSNDGPHREEGDIIGFCRTDGVRWIQTSMFGDNRYHRILLALTCFTMSEIVRIQHNYTV